MDKLIDSVLDTYLRAYRSLIAVEPADENSITLSFPFHLAASHRVELTVTDMGNGRCIISDAARTLGELEDAGYRSAQIRKKLEAIATLSGLSMAKDYLLLESSYSDLGMSLQKFLETSKTIGDIYLVHRQRVPTEAKLVAEVKAVLDSKSLAYRERLKIHGQIEDHPFDLVIPANRHPGMAASVLGGQNTHATAEIWGFKCDDIRREENNANIKLVLIYDVRLATWSETSKKILQSRADVALPGDSLTDLASQLEKHGILTA